MAVKTVKDMNLGNKRVLMRVDFNVPVKDGQVADDTRIQAAVPTIKYILEQGPRYIALMSHLGRPKGEAKPEFSLAPVAPVLAEALGVDVAFAADCIGEVAESAADALPEGGVVLLENTRFHAGETKNNPELAAQMAKLGDVFVNDAFGTAHRAHASNVGVSEKLPAVAGFLMEKEMDYLVKAIDDPQRPFVAILGGAKVSGKIEVIEALLGKVDKLLIGGGMANTFFKAKGIAVADSLVEDDALDTAKAMIEKGGDKLVLPTDMVIADAFDAGANTKTVPVSEGVPDGWRIMDIGLASVQFFATQLGDAKTVVWNGPMGVFEMQPFAAGTNAIANLLAGLDATTVIGGGDSAAAVNQSGLSGKMTHISTGGGASLELLEGKTLPGLAALEDK
jgi:phosphoglycerate kinase